MAEVASAYVTLLPSLKGFGGKVSNQISGDMDRAGRDGGKRFGGGLVSSLKGFAGPLAAAVGFSAITAGIKDVVNAGSELQQNLGGAEAVFKSSFGALDTAAKGAASTLGLTRSEYLSMATVLGAGLKNKGLKDYAGQTQGLLKIGADLAAQYGGSTKDAVDALASAMRGESDPIERYGIGLNETAVNSYLASKGLSKLKGAALEQAKAQARVAIVTAQSADATGAFGREAATFAGQQQRLTASFGNLKAQLGTKFLPVATRVSEFFVNSLPAVERFGKVLSANIGPVLKTVSTGFSAFVAAFREGDVTSDGFVGKMETLGDFLFRLKPVFGQIAAFIQTKFTPAVAGVITAFRGYLSVVIPIVQSFVNLALQKLSPFLPQVRELFASIGAYITAVMGVIRNVISVVTLAISITWARWGDKIMAVVGTAFTIVGGIIAGAFKIISGLFRTITALLTGDWSGAWEGIKQIVAGAWQVITTTTRTLGGVFAKVIGEKVGEAVQWFKHLPNRILTALGNFGDLLYDAGKKLIQGLIDGMGAMIGKVKQKAGDVASAIKDFFPGSPVKEGPLRSWNNGGAGKRLGDMLAGGLLDSQSTVASASARMAGQVRGGTISGAASQATGDSPLAGSGRMHPDDLAALAEIVLAGAGRVTNLAMRGQARSLASGVGGRG